MISILIPTYNYNITELIKALKTQLQNLATDYEVMCYEDGSSKFVKENSVVIKTIENATHIISKKNKGRVTTRQSLAEIAKYNWLLFLDADVIPKDHRFLKDYLKHINLSYDAIYGGYAYESSKPKSQFSLRWKYGKKHEQVEAEVRNKTPYKVIISGNFLIKKSTFLDINSKIENDGYGYDNYLGALMKYSTTKVFHINNNVIHKGLDTNMVFLSKVEKAVETVFEINQKQGSVSTENSLLEFYKKINSFGFSKVIALIFNFSKAVLKKQILSNNPNLTLLQFYKLGYLCILTSNKK